MKLANFYVFAIITMLIYAIVLFFYYDESQKSTINQAQIKTLDIVITEKFFNKSLIEENNLKKIKIHFERKKIFEIIGILTFSILILIFILVRLFVNKNNKESKKLQTVIDTLDQLILIKSNNNIHSINKSFSNFFNVNSITEFKEKYVCLSNHFMICKGYLNIDLSKIDATLIEEFKNTEKIKRVVKIANKKGKIRTLSIKIDKLEKREGLYIIVLSDITKLQKRSEMFEIKANTDSLTKLYSRAKFNTLYQLEFERSTRCLNPLTLLFIDIDNFKITNDTYGHDVGDIVLKKFSKLISKNIRKYDILARWGGEEFILMLPQTNINNGYKLAEKIRNVIASNKFEKIQTLTCSIGISTLDKGDEKETLIKHADNALYKAKSSGRNKTIIEI